MSPKVPRYINLIDRTAPAGVFVPCKCLFLDVERLPQIKALDVTMSVKSINSFAVAAMVFLSGAGVFGHTSSACADYYRYKNNKGIICITNNLNSIPPKYRSTMKVIESLVGNYFTVKTKLLGIFTRANVREAPETEVTPSEASGENAVK